MQDSGGPFGLRGVKLSRGVWISHKGKPSSDIGKFRFSKMCKLTKTLPTRGVVGFSGFRGEDLTRGWEKFRGVRLPSGLSSKNIRLRTGATSGGACFPNLLFLYRKTVSYIKKWRLFSYFFKFFDLKLL